MTKAHLDFAAHPIEWVTVPGPVSQPGKEQGGKYQEAKAPE